MNRPDTMEQTIKSQQELIAALLEANRALVEANGKLQEQTDELRQKVQELLSQIEWLKRQLFGQRSEKLAARAPGQLSLLDSVPAIEQVENICEKDRSAAVPSKTKRDGKKKESRRNRELIEGLPVVEVVIEPSRVDLDRYRRFGEERTCTLEFEPGRLYVKETVRPKYKLRKRCLPKEGESGVIIAPLPLSPVHKCLAGSTMLTEMLLQKYEYHVSFYKQTKEFRRLGVRLSESKLSGWFKTVCELLKPLYDELVRLVVGCGYVQVDETTVRGSNKGRGKSDKEYLWRVCAIKQNLVIFHYDDGSRSGQTIKNLLKDFKGYLQSGGYSAYNVFEDTEGVCLIASLAHIRHHFEIALEDDRSLAEQALKTIQEIYQIEQFADSRGYTAEERRELRIRQSAPMIDSFKNWMKSTYINISHKSQIEQAISYAYMLWPRMKTYLEDGNIKMDNHLVENALRPLALLRKDFLLCRDSEDAENAAVICSLLSTCKAQEVNPGEWMNDVIAKLPYYQEKDSGKNIRDLLPDVWNLKKGAGGIQ